MDANSLNNFVNKVIKTKPQTIVVLEYIRAKNDQLKKYTPQKMKDAGVELLMV